jgi:hypothetical protein
MRALALKRIKNFFYAVSQNNFLPRAMLDAMPDILN